MFKIALGTSHERDTAQAIGNVIAQAMAGLADARAQAGILLNSGHDADMTLLRAIHDTWPSISLIGSAGPAVDGDRALHLMLLNSPDLVFHIGLGLRRLASPQEAAERALAGAMPQAHNLALYLTLTDDSERWPQDFTRAAAKLLPEHCTCLEPLLPPTERPTRMDRHYHGLSVTTEQLPILLASDRTDDVSGWRFTRAHGIVRKQHGEAVYEYDRLIGDRRRPKPAA